MHVPRPRRVARPVLAFVAATCLLAAISAGPTLAGGNGAAPPSTRPVPREQKPGDATGYRLPFAPGLAVAVVQAWHSTYSHNGRAEYAYDFGLLDGTPVLAAASGIVSHAHGGETVCGGPELLRDLNYVTIDHSDGSSTLYGHLSTVDVKAGDAVSAGQQLGLSGRTGYTECRPHLHFARQLQGGPVTQSIPVFFDAYAKGPLSLGDMVTARPLPCAAPSGEAPATAAEADAPLGAFCGSYAALEARSPTMFERLESAILFDWDRTPPGGYWLDDPVDGFSARWTGRFEFGLPGTYRFSLVATGRVGVTIDGQTVLTLDADPAVRQGLSATVYLGAGVHRIDVAAESPDGTGSLALNWSDGVIDGAAGRWAQYRRPS